MPDRRIGVAIQERTPAEAVSAIIHAERLGIAAAWMTTGGTGPDGLTILSAAALQTQHIRLGTSIVPTFPRHPLALVQQALVVGNLAPGRLRLGIGPSHKPTIEGVFGIPFERPLDHLREYCAIVKSGLQSGRIDFDGAYFKVHGQIADPPGVPVLISALRPRSYRLAGEVADGAISWITPAPFLRDIARPALDAGSAGGGNDAKPILVGHVFAVVCEDQSAVVSAARERLSTYARLPFYQEMFAAAGYPDARKQELSDALIQSIVVSGDETQVVEGLRAFLAASIDELIVSILPIGIQGSKSRTLEVLAGLG